jgi:cytoskeleton-associated protein 5
MSSDRAGPALRRQRPPAAPGRGRPANEDFSDDEDPGANAFEAALVESSGHDDSEADEAVEAADAPEPFRSTSPPLPTAARAAAAAAEASDERPLGSASLEEAPLKSSSAFNSKAKDPFAGMADAYPPGFDPSSLASADADDDAGAAAGAGPDAFAALPVADRFVHKNFKARMSAYDELRAQFEASGERGATSLLFNEHGPLLRAALKKEPHALAGEKLLDLLLLYVDRAAAQPAQACAEASAAAAAEQLKGRPGVQAKASELLQLFVEVGGWEAVLDALVSSGKGKNPKQASEAVRALRGALAAFGPRIFPPARVLKAAAALLGSAADAVRRAAIELIVELDRWGAPGALAPAVAALELRPAIAKEVADAIALARLQSAGTGPVRATRFVRGKDGQIAPGGGPARGGRAAVLGGDDNGNDGGNGGDDDRGDELVIEIPAKDVCGDHPNWAAAFEAAPVWSERRALLAALAAAAAKAGRVAVTTATHDATAVIRKIGFVDVNAAVVSESVKTVCALARTAGSAFGPAAGPLLGPMLGLLREKKPAVAVPLKDALDALWAPGGVDRATAFDAVAKAAANKVSLVRAGALAWLTRAAAATQPPRRALCGGRGDEPALSALADALVPLLDDTDADVRAAALDLFARVAVPLRKRADTLLGKLAPKRADAVRERMAQMAGPAGAASEAVAEPERERAPARAGPASAAMAASPPRPGPVSRLATAGSGAGSGAARATPARAGPRPATAAPAAAAAPASGSGSGGPAPKLGAASREYKEALAFVPEPVLPLEAAVERLGAAVGAELLGDAEGIAAKNWKTASEACAALQGALLDLPPPELQALVSPLFSVVKATPGYGPAHAAVCKAACDLLAAVVSDLPAGVVTPTLAQRPLGDLLPRMADRKCADAAGALLTALAETVGPCFMLVQLHQRSAALKAPKALEAVALWAETALREFGVLTCDVRAVTTACRDWLDNANAGVRTAATAVLAELHRQTGGAVDDTVLAELKPATAARIKTAFGDCSEQEMAEGRARAMAPIRTVKGRAARASTGGATGAGGGGDVASALDALVAKIDLSAGCEAFIKKLNSKDWKERKEALDELPSFIPDKPNSVGPKVRAEHLLR